jgi:hypothetical protein
MQLVASRVVLSSTELVTVIFLYGAKKINYFRHHVFPLLVSESKYLIDLTATQPPTINQKADINAVLGTDHHGPASPVLSRMRMPP